MSVGPATARADSGVQPVASPTEALPRLSRRTALFGAAALLAPLAPRFAIAAPAIAVAAPAPLPAAGPIRLDSNENPYGP